MGQGEAEETKGETRNAGRKGANWTDIVEVPAEKQVTGKRSRERCSWSQRGGTGTEAGEGKDDSSPRALQRV